MTLIRIIGIDPGSQRTGVGVIDADAQGKLHHVHHHTLSVTAAATFPLRLKRIYDGVCAIIAAHGAVEAAVERVFMARNPDSALKLGQARGAAICAVSAQGVEVHEYSAAEVKQAVVGSGRADKTQVQHMVAALLALDGVPPTDAADALALAIAHAHTRASVARTGLPRQSWRRRR